MASDQLLFKFNPGLRERVQEGADAHGRSLTGEINATLEEKYPSTDVELDKAIQLIQTIIDKAEKGDKVEYAKKLQKLTAYAWFDYEMDEEQ